ncbi:PREDICTED: putative F-box protein At1g53550 [Prunus mume]|uniref:F-box protein At1g53550 n=1 Tax=Prunus mume TaxID=102107 RepID=A0ABM0PLS1_PRUMU|nr:PREDICTED: putative F-box protein At1g53550 [Prunus mume]
MQCRWVCKSWPSLIRSPSFVAAFLNFRCRDTTDFLFKYNNRYFSSKIEQQGNAPAPVAELPYLPQCEAVKGSFHDEKTVNGLVCASTWSGPVFILNPTTREFIELPHTDVLIETQGSSMVKASANYNFGFNPLTNEYKVHQHRHLLSDIARGIRNDGVYINGAVHWIHKKQKVIVAFDVREETFRLVPLPQDYAQVLDDYDDYESDADCYPRGSARVVEVG